MGYAVIGNKKYLLEELEDTCDIEKELLAYKEQLLLDTIYNSSINTFSHAKKFLEDKVEFIKQVENKNVIVPSNLYKQPLYVNDRKQLCSIIVIKYEPNVIYCSIDYLLDRINNNDKKEILINSVNDYFPLNEKISNSDEILIHIQQNVLSKAMYVWFDENYLYSSMPTFHTYIDLNKVCIGRNNIKQLKSLSEAELEQYFNKINVFSVANNNPFNINISDLFGEIIVKNGKQYLQNIVTITKYIEENNSWTVE